MHIFHSFSRIVAVFVLLGISFLTVFIALVEATSQAAGTSSAGSANGSTFLSAAPPLQAIAEPGVFTNSTPILIPDFTSAAAPYPSNITVSGLVGMIPATPDAVRVQINGLTHTFPDDLGILLVAPSGRALLLELCAGGSFPVTNKTYSISDAGAAQLPTGSFAGNATYRPASYCTRNGADPDFDPPAPFPYNGPGPAAGSTSTFQSTFAGENPNGVWSLYVLDFFDEDGGSITGGWSLVFPVPFGTPSPTPPATPTPTPTPTSTPTPTRTPTPSPTPVSTVAVSLPVSMIATPGASAPVNITASDTTGLNIVNYTFTLTYNPAVLSLPGSGAICDTAGTVSSNFIISCTANTPGTVRGNAYSVNGFSALAGAGTLFRLNFTAIGAGGTTSPLTFTNFRFNEGNPANVTSNGSVVIGGSGPAPTPTATVAPTPSPTPASGPLTVSVPVAQLVSPGAAFPVNLSVSDTTGRSILAYQFTITYNPAVISLPQSPAACETTGTLSSFFAFSCNSLTPGTVRVVVHSPSALPSGAGTLFKLNFTAVGAAGTSSPLTFTDFKFNEGSPAVVTSNGSVIIAGPAPTPTPSPTATVAASPIPTATVAPSPAATPVRVVSVSDVSQGEGNSGVTPFVFEVAISSEPPPGAMVMVDYTTVGGTGTPGSDYTAASGTLIFTAETPNLQLVTVNVIGDTTVEPNETFSLVLSNLRGTAGAAFNDAVGLGTIFNDDAGPTPTPGASPTPFRPEGDVVDADGTPNGDGLLLANDVTMARRFVLGLEAPRTLAQFRATDVNPVDGTPCGNGMLDAGDVTMIRQMTLGIVSNAWPACGPTEAATATIVDDAP